MWQKKIRIHRKYIFRIKDFKVDWQIHVLVLYGNVLGIFSDFFQCNSVVHGYSTRQSEHLHVPLERRNISQFCIRYRGVIVWNAILKSKINPDTSEFVFVKAFKACILDGNLTLWISYATVFIGSFLK